MVITATADEAVSAVGELANAGLPKMDDRQFVLWTDLLRERTGMHLPRARKSFLVTAVGLRMREVGFHSFQRYFEHLNSGLAGNLEWAALVDRLTIHETRFFRDPKALGFIRERVLPTLVESGRRAAGVQIWSAGCATGEEAYTLAMVTDRYLRESGDLRYYGVIGTDISLPALATAREGVFPLRRLPDIGRGYQFDYCRMIDDNRFRIADGIRRRVCFAQRNMVGADVAPVGLMDLVFCQNVLIYFDRERRLEIVDRLARRLRPGGVLMLGAGEVVGWRNSEVRRIGDTDVLAFRRIEE